MYRNSSNRVLPVILVLIIIAIVIAALVSVGRLIFGGGADTTQQANVDRGREVLLSTTADKSVRMTVRGPIVADENFRSYRISVDPSSRTFTTYSGYLDQRIDGKTLGNNVKAYEEFVYALDKAKLMDAKAFTDEKDDTRGICATGRVYEFEVLEDNNVVKRLWTSTCKGSPGSFRASVSQVSNLFKDQIPESSKMLNDIDL